jgi:hypothetical protein
MEHFNSSDAQIKIKIRARAYEVCHGDINIDYINNQLGLCEGFATAALIHLLVVN